MRKQGFHTVILFCLLPVLFISCAVSQTAQAQKRLVVDIKGKGDYRTIQGAINSLEDSADVVRVIFIKNGTYTEKIYLEKHNIILEGESREKTIITQAIARDEWRCQHNDDWGVATINIDGNDITLRNLTITNDFGFKRKDDDTHTVLCRTDTAKQMKTINRFGHQMALRSFKATRLRAINCHFRAFAGDTVSPWNTVDGMFYFRDCIMEGGVDFYCPRGYAWAENCKFYAHTGVASIWHDGSGNQDHKTVLVNCSFDGFRNFKLGRFHREAQFFLVDCKFSESMADEDIYHAATGVPLKWGRRVYYSGCKRSGGNYSWFADNLATSGVRLSDITVQWLFKNQWQPQLN